MINNTLVLMLLIALLGLTGTASAQESSAKSTKPNIIYILADDMGYGDLGAYGQTKIKTPNLDKMAQEGVKFTQHYAGSTVCGPSRASLLTGLHSGHSPIRGNPTWTDNGKPVDLKDSDITIGEMLKEAGYQTAVIGKWGMTEDRTFPEDKINPSMPNQQGFDYFFGFKYHRDAHYYYWNKLYENNSAYLLEDNDYLKNTGVYTHDLFTNKAIDYIKGRDKKDPFFLYLAYTIPHLAMTVPEDSKKPYEKLNWPERKMNTQGHYRNDKEGNVTYAGMVSRMDRDVGALLSLLKKEGLDENTLVIFTSDNGHHYDNGFFNSNGPFKGKKRDLYEGGIRVPFIAKWPNKITPASESGHVSAMWDMMPTFCDLAGNNACPKNDGVSMIPTLLNQGKQQEHELLYWEFNERQGPIQAIRNKNWKLVRFLDKPAELYDLSKDAGEEFNLAQSHPELTKKLTAMMDEERSPHPQFSLKRKVKKNK